MSEKKLPNPCPHCNNSENGYESPEARDSHIHMFHPEKPIKKQDKEKR